MATQAGKMTRKQEQAIAALLSSPTVVEAAEAVGIGERTLFRWLQEDEFQEKYREARRQAVSQAVAQIQRGCTKAVRTLEEVMDDTEAPSSSRVSAAKTYLDVAFKAIEIEDLEVRLDELERLVEERVGVSG